MRRRLIAKTFSSFLGVALSIIVVNAQCTIPNFSVTEFNLPAPGHFIAVADFNRDGRDDVAVPDNSKVQVLVNDGVGGFKPPLEASAGTTPKFVAVGEFDGDGRLDLAVAGGTGTTDVTILKGAGNGKFSPLSPVSLGTSITTNELSVGDVNNDGNEDIVTVNNNSSYSVLIGNGAGGFTAARTQLPFAATANLLADINRNGSLDIVFACASSNQIALLLGNGDGTFGAPATFPVGTRPVDLAGGDFNRDGKLDVVTANELGDSFSLLLGNGAGSFGAATTFSEGGSVEAIVATDLNGDGKLDVAFTKTNGLSPSHVSVRFGNGNGTFNPAADFAITFVSFSLEVGKFGSGCKPDLVMSMSSVGRMPVLFNNCP